MYTLSQIDANIAVHLFGDTTFQTPRVQCLLHDSFGDRKIIAKISHYFHILGYISF